MNKSESDFIFKCETTSGYIIKVLTDILNNNLTDNVIFVVTEEGMFSRSHDNNKRIMIDIRLKMEEFDFFEFKQDEPFTFSIALKQLQESLRDIKKKDSIQMLITEPNAIKIIISNKDKSDKTITELLQITGGETPDITELTVDYHPPKNIPAIEFQKLCKRFSKGTDTQEINVIIQKNHYVSFECKVLTTSLIEFGEKKASENHIYQNSFYVKTLTQLSKIPGLCSKLKLYAPVDKKHTIKLTAEAGNLGFVDVYIKSKAQIDNQMKNKGR